MAAIAVTVDNALRIPLASLRGREVLHDRLKAECTHSNPLFYKHQRMGVRWTKEQPQLRTYREDGIRDELVLSRGCTGIVRKLFAEFGIEPQWVDNRSEGDVTLRGALPPTRMTLWDAQQDVVSTMVEGEQGLVRSPAGSGKTTAALALAAQVQLPTLVIVWSAALLKQWIERAVYELGLDEDEVGQVGSGVTRWRALTIAMQQSLSRDPKKLKHAVKTFGVVIADEVQRFAAATFLDVIGAFPARYRIGISDDETRKDGKEFLTYDVFGEVRITVQRRELLARGDIVPVKVVMAPTDFNAAWYLEQQEEGERADFNRLLDEMMKDDARNAVVLGVVRMALDRGEQCFVLSHRREHCKALQSAIGGECGLMLGGADGKEEFDAALASMNNGRGQCAVGTYQAMGQGIDAKTVSVGVATTPIHANRQFFQQVRGRIGRKAPNKEGATLYVLWDAQLYGAFPLANFMKWNERNVYVLERDGTVVHAATYKARKKESNGG